MKLLDVELHTDTSSAVYKFDDGTEQTITLTIPLDTSLFENDMQSGIITMLFALIHDMQGQIDLAHTRINGLSANMAGML